MYPNKVDKRDKVFLKTADGTFTLADKGTGEWFHNSAGAYSEAMDNYVRPALALLKPTLVKQKSVKLLDSCFGLGYNSFCLISYILENEIPVDTIEIRAVELDPKLAVPTSRVLKQECFKVLKRTGVAGEPDTYGLDDMFQAGPEESVGSGSCIEGELYPQKASVKKIKFKLFFDDMRHFIPAAVASHAGSFDLIFHDPFSPAKFPQFWTEDLFGYYRKLLIGGEGMLFTYSIAAAVRGALLRSGFSIYKTKAVGKKQGGTLAVANIPVDWDGDFENNIARDLSGLKHYGELSQIEKSGLFFTLDGEEVSKVLSASGIPYRDKSMAADRKTILKNREQEQTVFKQSSGN